MKIVNNEKRILYLPSVSIHYGVIDGKKQLVNDLIEEYGHAEEGINKLKEND